MFQSKLVRLLKAFSGEELSQLRQFLKSPLFNDGSRPQKVQALLEHLAHFHPTYEEEGLKEERVFDAVFSGEKSSGAKLDKVASELVKSVRKFIALHCSDGVQSDHQFWLAQARFFRQRGLDGEFHHALEQLEKQQQEASCKEEDYFFRQFSLEAERFKHLIGRNDKKTDGNLPDVIQQLDIYYIISKMEYCSYLLTRGVSTHLDSPQSFTLLNEVLDIVQKNFLHVPIAAAYFHAFSLLLHREQDEGKAYRLLKAVLDESGSQFSAGTLKMLHSYMRNHIADRYNHGETACLPELLALFKEHNRLGTLCQDGRHIFASTLQSAVTVALKLGDHAWASDFLQQHRHRIVGADDPESIYQFNLANCHFHRGGFEAAERCLSAFQFREMFYKLAARRLELKLLYETASPLLDARLDAFKIFIHDLKKTLPPNQVEPNNRFADLLRQILSPKTLGNKTRIEKLLEKLNVQKAVAEREWLVRKLEDLRI